MKKSVIILLVTACCLTALLGIFVSYKTNSSDPTEENWVVTRESITKFSQSFYFDRFDIVHAYYIRSEWVTTWEFPYSFTNQEYPPLGVLFFSIPRMLTSTEHGYVQAFVCFALVTYVAFLFIMWKLLDALHRPRWYMAALFLPSFLYFVASRFDIFATLIVMTAVWLLVQKKFVGSMVLLGVAMLIKWYPIFLIPFAIAWATRQGVPLKTIRKGIYWAVAVFVATTGVTILMSGLGALFPYAFHTSRFIEIGSVAGVVLKLLYAWDLPVGSETALVGIGLALFGFQLIPLLYGVLSYADMKRRVISFDDFLRFSVLAVIIFAHIGKIYSPQWEIWWLPLALLVMRGRFEWTLLIIIDVLNYIMFPFIPILFESVGFRTFYFDALVIFHAAAVLLLSVSISKPLFTKGSFKEIPGVNAQTSNSHE